MEYYCHEKEWNSAIFDKDGTWGYYAKCNKSVKDICYVISLSDQIRSLYVKSKKNPQINKHNKI